MILIVYTGGTFGMNEKLQVPDLSASALKARLENAVPEMKRFGKCALKVYSNQDSCQFQPHDWFGIADLILQNKSKYKGAVILHGTDTLAFSASALSNLISPAPFPVVITGAQKPLFSTRNDARINLISSLEIVSSAPKTLKNRVMVLFQNQLLLGSRVRKTGALDFAAFESPRFPALAEVGGEIVYHDVIHHLPKLGKKPLLHHFRTHSNPLPQVPVLEMTPQFPVRALSVMAQSQHLDGIILNLYASGTAPTEQPGFLELLKDLKANHVPVVAITERGRPNHTLAKYKAGKELAKEGVLWGHDLTPEAAYTRFWLILELLRGQSKVAHSKKATFQAFKKMWQKRISDEMN